RRASSSTRVNAAGARRRSSHCRAWRLRGHGTGKSAPETGKGRLAAALVVESDGVPTGIRTPVSTVKGWCPRPLDDGTCSVSSNVTVKQFGGARRDRTADLLHAMQALSQLSYGPTRWKARKFNGGFRTAQAAR